MSKISIVCLSWLCTETLSVVIIDDGEMKHSEQCGGELCRDCAQELEAPKAVKFNTPRIGEVSVQKPSDFNEMMAKRKMENRKASGKGPPRGGR